MLAFIIVNFSLRTAFGVRVIAQWKPIRLGTIRLQIRSLASLSGLRIRRCRELWCRSRCGLDLVLLWLWCRLTAVALIAPLAWKPPYAAGAALKMQKRPKKKKKKKTGLKKKKRKFKIGVQQYI